MKAGEEIKVGEVWKKCKSYIIRPKFKRIKVQKDIKRNFRRGRLDEFAREVKYIEKNGAAMFPYDFTKKYHNLFFEEVGYDENHMPYIMYENKKVYFPKYMSLEKAKTYLKNIIIEQDLQSPHCYFTEKIEGNNLVFVDCGAAEGFMTLQFIDRVSKAYVIEGDKKWHNALRKTLDPWKDKIIYIDQYLDEKTCLDDICQEREGTVFIIKMDIEGAEMTALLGAEKLLRENFCIVSACTYHKENDFQDIYKYLSGLNYNLESSQGYCLWYFEDFLKYPYFRKGLIRGKKINGK